MKSDVVGGFVVTTVDSGNSVTAVVLIVVSHCVVNIGVTTIEDVTVFTDGVCSVFLEVIDVVDVPALVTDVGSVGLTSLVL